MDVERRKHKRWEVSLPVSVRILAEEETFTPFQYNDGRCENLSPAGAMVSLPSITPEQYEVVFRRPRLMRMKCVLPPNKEPVAFFGRVIWHEIHRQEENTICRAAVVFEPLDFKTREQLEQFLLEWA